MGRRKKLWQVLLPKEHGTWAMWVLPFILGVAAAGTVSIASFLMFGVSLLAFFVRTAFASIIRLRKQDKRLMGYCKLAAFLEIVLIFILALPMLLAGNYVLAIIGLLAFGLLIADLHWISDRSERHLITELLGVAGFALAAPAAYVATNGAWHFEAGLLWFISFAYFSGSVFYVKLRLARASKTKSPGRVELFQTRLILLYTILVSGMTLFLSSLDWVSPWLILAFLPWVAHLAWEAFHFQRLNQINRVGWTLVAHSIYFTILVSLVFRLN